MAGTLGPESSRRGGGTIVEYTSKQGVLAVVL
jgi:hypothetical protein